MSEAARHFSPFWARLNQSTPPSYFLKTHFIIILPTMPMYPKFSVSLTFSQQTLYAPPTYVPHAHAFHSSWSDHRNKIWLGVQVMKIFIMQSTPVSCYFVRLRPKYIPKHPILKHPQPSYLSVDSVDIMLKVALYGVLRCKIQNSVLSSIVWGGAWKQNETLGFCEWVWGQVGVGSGVLLRK